MYCILFVKYANNYCIIADIVCINMHHITTDDKALMLALRVEKRRNINDSGQVVHTRELLIPSSVIWYGSLG